MRKVVILSGVSGSGKTTLAMKAYQGAFEQATTIAVVSADTYFISEDGTYKFDPTKLSDAHGACFRRFIAAVQNMCELVVVDNTNTTSEEIAPYILGAQAFGYEVEIVTLKPRLHHAHNLTDAYIKLCAERNKHGVGEAGIRAQFRRLMDRKLAPWWKNTDVYETVSPLAEEVVQ